MADLIGAASASLLLHRSRSWLSRKILTGEIVPDGRLGENGAYLFERRKIERLAARLAKIEALQAGDAARAAS